jgi:glucose-6-phosphate isomerase
MTSTLDYDRSGLTTAAVGERGVSDDASDALAPDLERARAAVLDAHARGDLGFMDLADLDAAPFTRWADALDDALTDQVVIGIGGSTLGALAILETAGPAGAGGLRTHFAENMDPVAFGALAASLDMATTLLVVITKSGTTVETMSKFWILYAKMREAIGDAADGRVVAITDPERGALRPLAEQRGWTTFSVPPNVGGRFSVLTPVGLVPLAAAGYDVASLLAGAADARDAARDLPVADNLALQAAADAHLLYQQGVSIYVMMAYSDLLSGLVDWFRQLWAESLGKRTDRQGRAVHVGQTPVKALGVIDQHSQCQLYMEGPFDKVVALLEVGAFPEDLTVPDLDGFPSSLSHLVGRGMSEILAAELRGTQLALADAGRPTCLWTFPDLSARSVGAFVMTWEFVTAIVGELWDIDAFDQPGVELGKKIAHGLLGREDLVAFASGFSLDAGERGALSIPTRDDAPGT